MDYKDQDYITDESGFLRAEFELVEGQPSLLDNGMDNPDYTVFLESKYYKLKKEIHSQNTLMFKVVAGEKSITDLQEYLTKDKK